jgi:hypothetical protein
MVAVKFIVWFLLNLFFVVFVVFPGTLLAVIIAPIYYAWGIVVEQVPEFMERVDKWLD